MNVRCKCGAEHSDRMASRGYYKGWPAWGCSTCGAEWVVGRAKERDFEGRSQVRVLVLKEGKAA